MDQIKKLLVVLLFASSTSWAAHPLLITTKDQWSAMISSSTVQPWASVAAAATTYIFGPVGTSYNCVNLPSQFGSASAGIRQQNENGFMNQMGSLALMYVLNSNNSGSITYRNSITCLMDLWPSLRADQPESDVDGYLINVPLNGAFFNMTIALDVIHDQLTPVQLSSYTTMMDSWVAYSRTLASSWALSNYGTYMTYSIYRGTDSLQIATDSNCYHTGFLGNDRPYPPAVCGERQARRYLSSEISQGQLDVDGVSGSGSSYAWARIGGQGREKIAKWAGQFVANFTGVDTTFRDDGRMTTFYEWLFAGMTTPFNTKVVIGDTANNQFIGEDQYQGNGTSKFTLKNAHVVAGQYSARAQRWANYLVNLSTLTKVYPSELIDYVAITSTATAGSPPESLVVRHGGAAFWEDNASSNALQGILSNYHITRSDHYHASDFNGMFLTGYGEILLSNVGIGEDVEGGILGFPKYWHKDDARSGNVLLIGNRNYAQDVNISNQPANSFFDWNPFFTGEPAGVYVGNGVNTPLYGGDGIQESLVSDKFDYAVGIGTSQYVFHSTTTGAITEILGENYRNFIFVHPDDGQNGYWIVADEIHTSSTPSVNTVWHPYGPTFTTTTVNTEYAWPISNRGDASTTTLHVFLATPPQSVFFSSSPFSATPASFVGTYLNARFNVDASSNARVVTVLYPTNPTHTKSTFTQVSNGDATGASIVSGAYTDYVLASSGTGVITTASSSFQGRLGFFRKSGSSCLEFFVRKGISFNDGNLVRYGFSSNVPISLHLNDTTGSITSPTSANVTFYYPGILGVSIDDVLISGTDGINAYTIAVSSGEHDVDFSVGAVEYPSSIRGPTSIRGAVRFK